ncbi:MAG: hypothetical protein JO070_06745 [Verrucomicrobia bacterium]|nr:hypothetical protein [Verrucomicrobiota bacterium]
MAPLKQIRVLLARRLERGMRLLIVLVLEIPFSGAVVAAGSKIEHEDEDEHEHDWKSGRPPYR